jgi:hypothetical protein
MMLSMARILFVLATVFLVCAGHCQAQIEKISAESPKNQKTLTGILLVSDRLCDEYPADGLKDKWACPEGSSQWGLIALGTQYSVHGEINELKQYECRRVTVTGIVSPSSENFLDRFDVQSIGASEMPESQIRELIEQLKDNQWAEPKNIANPTTWVFNFTPPMLQILEAGTAAQDVLLQYLDDPIIKDQIIILLGGVGDRKAIKPIIDAMTDGNVARDNEYARKINLAANLALTNITVGDVIWHHGGGISVDACPVDPQSCWNSWWLQKKESFDLAKTMNRNYSNYPSYGIYQDPGLFRSEATVNYVAR